MLSREDRPHVGQDDQLHELQLHLALLIRQEVAQTQTLHMEYAQIRCGLDVVEHALDQLLVELERF